MNLCAFWHKGSQRYMNAKALFLILSKAGVNRRGRSIRSTHSKLFTAELGRVNCGKTCDEPTTFTFRLTVWIMWGNEAIPIVNLNKQIRKIAGMGSYVYGSKTLRDRDISGCHSVKAQYSVPTQCFYVATFSFHRWNVAFRQALTAS